MAESQRDLYMHHSSLESVYRNVSDSLYTGISSSLWPARDTVHSFYLVDMSIAQQPFWLHLQEDFCRYREQIAPLAGKMQQLGRRGEALELYRIATVLDPVNPQAFFNLGCSAYAARDYHGAISAFSCSLELSRNNEQACYLLGNCFVELGRYAEAEECFSLIFPSGPLAFERLLALSSLSVLHDARVLNPDQIQGLVRLSDGDSGRAIKVVTLLIQAGLWHEARSLFDAAYKTVDSIKRGLAWGGVLSHVAPKSECDDHLQALLATYPDDVDCLLVKASRLMDSDPEGALLLWNHLKVKRPTHAAIWGNLALTQSALLQREAAHESFLLALSFDPYLPSLYLGLGSIFHDWGFPHPAMRAYRAALWLSPFYGEVLLNIGTLLHGQGGLHESVQVLRRSVAHIGLPAHAELTLGLVLLFDGQYEEGWQCYESRLESLINLPELKALPRWDGQSPKDEILLVAEQGIGDVIQFMRFAPVLSFMFQRVSVLAPLKICGILDHYGGFSDIFASVQSLSFEGTAAWLPMGSVMGMLGLTADNMPVSGSYLSAVPDSADLWRQRIRTHGPCVYVGLHWQGNPEAEKLNSMAGRSFPLELLAPLAEVANVRFVSLQKGPGSEQLDTCSFRHRFVDCQPLVSDTWDFVEGLSIISACDLVISSDSGLVHLAGALGAPVWLLLKYVPDWRWGRHSERTAWYDSMRLYRQQWYGVWQDPLDRVREDLEALVAEKLSS